MSTMPWLKIATSGPVWALIVANFSTDWGLYTFLTNIPSFYNEVLYFDIRSVSEISPSAVGYDNPEYS